MTFLWILGLLIAFIAGCELGAYEVSKDPWRDPEFWKRVDE